MSKDQRGLGVLFIGNFLSASKGTRFYCEDLANRLEDVGIQVFRASSRVGRTARVADMIATALREQTRYAIALLDVYSGPSFRWAELLAELLRRLGKPVVTMLRGGALPEFAHSHPARVYRFLERATMVVTPSRFLQESFRHLRADIRYLPNAVELGVYPYSLRVQPAATLCWLRAFDEIYDPMMAVKTLRSVRAQGEEAVLTMVGPTRYPSVLQYIKTNAVDWGLGEVVRIAGPIPKVEVPNMLSRHDVFINTTRFESFGVAVLEAAACGLPIVSTAVGEIPYLWKDEEEVLLVPPGDARAMAEAVLRILQEPEIAARLSHNARKKAETFGWETVLPQWLMLLREIKGIT